MIAHQMFNTHWEIARAILQEYQTKLCSTDLKPLWLDEEHVP